MPTIKYVQKQSSTCADAPGAALRSHNEAAGPIAPLLLTIPQAADALGVSRSTLYRLIGTGDVETVHVRGLQRIRPQALERFVDRIQRNARERAVGLT